MQVAINDAATKLGLMLRARGATPQSIAVVRTTMDRIKVKVSQFVLGEGDQRSPPFEEWEETATLIDQLESNPSEQAVVRFGAAVIGKVDVAYINYKEISDALEAIESRLPAEHWVMVWRLVEYSGGFILQCGPGRWQQTIARDSDSR